MITSGIRQTVRRLVREPGFTACAVLTLTLGIGANTALFTVVDAVLLRPLPYQDADRLVVLRHRDLRTGLTKPDVAIGDFVDLRARQRTLEALAGFGGFQGIYLGRREPLRVEGVAVTPDALDMLRVRPTLGRLLAPDDARAGAAPVAAVSYEFWRTELGSDPLAVTRSIQLDGQRRLVVGVLPAGFRFPTMTRTDVVVPQELPATPPAQRRGGWMYGIGRLRPGQSIESAAEDLAALSEQFAREHPEQNQGSRYEASSLRDTLVGDTRRTLLLLTGSAGFVLLIACANVGNLLLARQIARRHEIAVRMALGAGRARLVAEVLAEGCVLALAGGASGVLVAWAAAPALATFMPQTAVLPNVASIGVDATVLLFSIAAATISALLFSGIACIALLRSRPGLLTERRQTLTPGAQLTASALVAAEIAVAVVLLSGAGLTLRSFGNLLAVDPGFTATGVLTTQLSLPSARYREASARRAFYARAMESMRALPGVAAVGAAMVTPMTGNNWTAPLQRVDRPLPAGERPPEVGWQLASRGYFDALRIPLRAGRLFDARDVTGPPVVIVSEAVAQRHFAGENPLGHRINLGDVVPEIVGVVGNIRRASLADAERADLYFPFEQGMPGSITLFVRTAGDPMATLPALRSAVAQIEPAAAIYEPRALRAIAEDSAASTRLAARLLVVCAGIALLLAAVGVYGTMAYRVRRRTRELGTRMALGATPGAVTRLVLRQSAGICAVGLIAGMAANAVATRTLSLLLFGVERWDTVTLAAVAVTLGGAVFAASYLPARRAARVDPATVLAAE